MKTEQYRSKMVGQRERPFGPGGWGEEGGVRFFRFLFDFGRSAPPTMSSLFQLS